MVVRGIDVSPLALLTTHHCAKTRTSSPTEGGGNLTRGKVPPEGPKLSSACCRQDVCLEHSPRDATRVDRFWEVRGDHSDEVLPGVDDGELPV